MLIEAGNSQNSNVLSLFATSEEQIVDPLQTLLEEAELEAFSEKEEELQAPRAVVQSHQMPDQSIYVLEKQLESLKGSLSRLNFYINDIQDILPI